MPLSRRRFLASVAGLTPAALASLSGRAFAQGAAALPLTDPLVKLAGSCILGGSRSWGLHPQLRAMLSAGALGGVLVDAGNFRDAPSLDAVVQAIRAATPADDAPAIVSADQEGGIVSHLSPTVPWLPSIHTLGAIDDTALTRRWGTAMGTALRRAGVNLDLAPVLDVRTNPRNFVVHLRTFGSRPDVCERHARPAIQGMLDAGVMACAKHFPGHGDTDTDSHQGLPRVRHDLARLDAVELVPFRAVADLVPTVMLAHVVYAGVDAASPATLSRAIAHGLLRERLSFRGVAISDDLEMAAIRNTWGVAAGAVRSMEAGCDLLCIAHTPPLALASARAMARRAAVDADFRARLEEAAGRVRALRERLHTAAITAPATESVAAVTREVMRRAATLGRRPTTAADPTRARQP